MKNFKAYIISVFCFILNKVELYLIFLLKDVKSKVVKYNKNTYKGPEFHRFHGFLYFVNNIFLFPLNIFYWIYIAPAVYVWSKIFKIIHTIFRKNVWYKQFLSLISTVSDGWELLKGKVLANEIVELLFFCVGASLEVCFSFLGGTFLFVVC
jgi:hypothetical protein